MAAMMRSLAVLLTLVLTLVAPPRSHAQQEAFALLPRSGLYMLTLDDIAADEALRELGQQLGFEVVWRVQAAPTRLSGQREGAVGQIVAWILRGYDYAMVTTGRGIDQRPVRIVVFSERNPLAQAPPPPDDAAAHGFDGAPIEPPASLAPEAPDEAPPIADPAADGMPEPTLAPYDPADLEEEPPP
jgi:hypothetical protein